MKTWGLAFLLCTPALPALAQPAPTGTTIKETFDLVTTDELGHVYALKGDELFLFDAKGKRLARNSVKSFGEITSMDAFSSLKPMIFSRPQGMLAVLDNTLAVQGDPIDLNRNGFAQVTLACMSVQNAFWFYDERLMQLSRVDRQLRPLAETGRLDQLIGSSVRPVFMQEFDSWLYLCDPELGVLVFDLFGGYSRTLPLIGTTRIEVRDGRILYLKDGVLHSYDLRTGEINIPITWINLKGNPRAITARVERGLLYVHFPEKLVIDTPEPKM